MNLPNKLTCLRVLMIPVFIAFMMLDMIPGNRIIAFAVFVLACLTDMLDGKIARKYHLVTDFGKFMDPLADKLLVCSALILFVGNGSLPSWVCIIIIAREFTISGFRLIASNKGIVIAASMWGKVKTVIQMFLCFFLILGFDFLVWNIICQVLIYAAVALTVISLVDYIWKNKQVIGGDM